MFYTLVPQGVFRSYQVVFSVLWNMCKQHPDRLQQQIRKAGKIIGSDQGTATKPYTKIILQKPKEILQGSRVGFTLVSQYTMV